MFFAVVDKGKSEWGMGMVFRVPFDCIECVAVAVAESEGRPVGGYGGVEGEGVALFVEAEDAFDAGLVGP